MIGYATGNRVMDFIFTEPYSYEFAYIAEIVPESAGCDKLKWIQDKTLEEVNRFVHLLKELVCTLFKGNTYKKYIDA